MTNEEYLVKIKGILEETPEVVAGYFFGSIQEGYEHKKSDIDIGVLFDNSLDKFRMFDLEIKLGNKLQGTVKKRVDLLVLNRSDPIIAFKVIRGALIFERDPTRRSLFEAKVMGLYYHQRHYERFRARVLYERMRNYESVR
ncbi:MAG: nucleotidyltransferase domain-containing protein [candidate division WOR-3 bacterium]